MKDNVLTFKIIVFGDGGVGKTSLTHRYLTGVFSEGRNVTIGVEFYVKDLLIEGKSIKLQIWDFGGEQRFRFLLPNYCRGCNGGIFVYDVTNLATLQSLHEWMEVVSANAPNIPVLIVGTKIDLVEKRKVARAEAIKVAQSLTMTGYAEVSSKTGNNVENVFVTLSKIMLKQKK